MERYLRQIMLPEIGEEGQHLIGKASVLLVGVGGLGSVISQYLVAAGIGSLGIVDKDTVSSQPPTKCTQPQLGTSQSMTATILAKLNSEVNIEAYNVKFTKTNACVGENYHSYRRTDNILPVIFKRCICGMDKPLVTTISEFYGQFVF